MAVHLNLYTECLQTKNKLYPRKCRKKYGQDVIVYLAFLRRELSEGLSRTNAYIV